MSRLVNIDCGWSASDKSVITRELAGPTSTLMPFSQAPRYSLFQKSKNVNPLVIGKSQVLPTDIHGSRLAFIKIENSHDVIIAIEVVDLKIPDTLVSIRLEKIERSNINGWIDATQQLNPIGREIHQTVAG